MLATFLLAAAFGAAPADSSDEPRLDFAVEQAAREFRITVYGQFRTSRDEFDARRKLGNELLKLWNKAELPARHREAVLAWFQEATRRSQAGQPLAPYADLADLQTLTVADELPEGTAEAPAEIKPQIKLPPPFVLETPAGAVVPTEDESLWTRLKGLFSGPAKTTTAPAPGN